MTGNVLYCDSSDPVLMSAILAPVSYLALYYIPSEVKFSVFNNMSQMQRKQIDREFFRTKTT